MLPFIVLFFFQAEDGIRDLTVTGVQTCALPISLADGQVAGVVLLNVEEWRSVARIEDLIVGRQFRRYGIGSLLLNCADDWARKQGCWAIVLETQNVNYPAIQFYLRNGLEVWSIHQRFYPPGPVEHEVAVFMGKKLR